MISWVSLGNVIFPLGDIDLGIVEIVGEIELEIQEKEQIELEIDE